MRFTLARMLAAATIAAAVACLFSVFPWPIATLLLGIGNLAVSLAAWLSHRVALTRLALATAALIGLTLFYTDWGVSSPNSVVRVAWPFAIAAIIAQTLTVGAWMIEPSGEASPQNAASKEAPS